MTYLMVDMDGATHARFNDAATLLEELDRIRADEPEMIDELAVLKYDSEGRRTGAPVSASSLIPKQAHEVGAVLVESFSREWERPIRPATITGPSARRFGFLNRPRTPALSAASRAF